MKKIFVLLLILFPLVSQANTTIQYNTTGSNPTLVTVSFCKPGTITWVGCAGGNPIQINPNQQLNIENVCQLPVTGSAYQVSILTQTTISQSCLTTNGSGTMTLSNPNGAPVLSGSFYGNGTACGTSCG